VLTLKRVFDLAQNSGCRPVFNHPFPTALPSSSQTETHFRDGSVRGYHLSISGVKLVDLGREPRRGVEIELDHRELDHRARIFHRVLPIRALKR